MTQLLLHACCAPCSLEPVRLLEDALRELPDKQRADLRGHQLSPEVGQFVFCWHGRFPLSCEIARMADGRDCENSQSASNYFMENESCFHTLNRISL